MVTGLHGHGTYSPETCAICKADWDIEMAALEEEARWNS